MPSLGPDISIHDSAYVHPTAQLYGAITIGEGASIWPSVVMRAEAYDIQIGRYTNVQDFVLIHIGWETSSIIGDFCSITHHCTIHGCTIGDNCLIGINATIMDGAVIGDNSIVAGHAIVSAGMVVPPNSIVAGVPAKVVKTRDNLVPNRANALLYYRNAKGFAQGDHRAWAGMDFDAFVAQIGADVEGETARQISGST